MLPVTQTKISGHIDDTRGCYAEVVKNQHRNRLEQAFYHSYHINDDLAEILQGYFPHRYVAQRCSGKLKESSHPILAILNEYCNVQAAALIKKWNSKGHRTLSIGDSSSSKVGADHNCLLVDNVRDYYRVGSEEKAPTNLRNFASGLSRNTSACVNGCHTCHYKATRAVAVHSIYDITPQQIFQTFLNHGLTKLVAYIFIPLVLHDEKFHGLDSLSSDVIVEKPDIYFTMKDHSIPYVHNFENWRKWATISKIQARISNGVAPTFDIAIEHVRTNGPLHTLHFQAVRRCNQVFPLVIPISTMLDEVYFVPNMIHAIRNNFSYPQKDTPHIPIPRHVADNVLRYAMRVKDESYKFTELSAVMCGYSTQIILNNKIYRKQWRVAQNDYFVLNLSIFVLGALDRMRRTTGISRIFSEFKTIGEMGFFGSCWYDISSYLHRLFNKEVTSKDIMAPGKYINEFHLLVPEDIIYREVASVEFDVAHPNRVLMDSKCPCGNENRGFEEYDKKNQALVEKERSGRQADKDLCPIKSEIKNSVINTIPTAPPASVVSDVKRSDGNKLEDQLNPVQIDLHDVSNKLKNLCDDKRKCNNNENSFVINHDPKDISHVVPVKPDDSASNIIRTEVLSCRTSRSSSIDSSSTDLSTIFTGSSVNSADRRVFINNNGEKAKSELLIPPQPFAKTVDSVSMQVKGVNGTTASCDKKTVFNTVADLHRSDSSNKLFNDVPFYCDVPRAFKAGHCAMRAFWACYPQHCRPSQKQILLVTAHALLDAKHDYDLVRSYIVDGQWNNDLSALVLPTLSRVYDVEVHIHEQGKNPIVLPVRNNTNHVAHIYYADNHYFSQTDPGGSKEKYPALLATFEDHIKSGDEILDMTAAPGYFVNLLSEHLERKKKDGVLKDVNLYAGAYTGVFSSVFTQRIDGFKLQKYSGNFDLLFPEKKFNIIICDAGRAVNTEALTKAAVQFAAKRLLEGGIFVVKTFGDPHFVYEFARRFEYVDCYDSTTFAVGTERYFVLGNLFSKPIVDFYHVYDTYHVDQTTHCYSFTQSHMLDFTDHYFKEFQKLKPKWQNLKLSCKHSGSFKAITGFASASKTTIAIKKYPNAVFISPTKKLSLKHNGGGVKSYTPHAAFANIKNGDCIVIDELSQFCVEYVALLKIVFPDSLVIVLGDIYQTSAFGLDDFTKFSDIGVSNNIIDVYKIPQDIADCLNRKEGWNLRSHSDVKRALVKYPNIDDLIAKKVQILTYNASTCAELKAKAAVVNTITTYTGSREPVVALYLDSNAVVSQYVNNTSATYTAITRATERLILVGDTDQLEKYYNFTDTMIDTYFEINKLFPASDTFTLAPSMVLTQSSSIAEETGSVDAARMIVEDAIKTSNPAADTIINVQTGVMPPVLSGTLKTNEAAITPMPQDVMATVVSKTTNVVINQLSSNSVETIKTLIKRYSKSYSKPARTAESKLVYNELVGGLHKALYGRSTFVSKRFVRDMRATREELMLQAFAYIESLDKKLGPAVYTSQEVNTMFDEHRDGKLSFFNKRQAKFSAKDGFDTSDKVGQGVAAFEKKVNIVYGAYARCMLDKVKKILTDNGRNIILATHDSEAGLNNIITGFLTNRKENNIYTCNDFSEWDASFRDVFANMTSYLLTSMGMPQSAVDWFRENRKEWDMYYQNSHGTTKLHGTEKQFSGNPFTIAENTISNMALCFSLFDYKDMDFALFKGDDSAVSCRKCVVLPKGEKILAYTQHGLKLHNSPIGEFAGWFLTDCGLFPDVLRYSSKFLSKNYIDEDHFNEALASLQERCAAVHGMEQLNEGCAIVSSFYSDALSFNITPEMVRILYYFLRDSRYIKFNELESVRKHVHVID